MANDELDQIVEEKKAEILAHHGNEGTNKINDLVTKLKEIKYAHFTFYDPYTIARAITSFASQGHPFETLEGYYNNFKRIWDKFEMCYEDASDPDRGGGSEIQNHLFDLFYFEKNLEEQLPIAINTVTPKFSASIFPFLELIESYRDDRLTRIIAWTYQVSSLTALGNLQSEFVDSENLVKNPLEVLALAFKRALDECKNGTSIPGVEPHAVYAIITPNEEQLHHCLRLPIRDPGDVEGIEKMIRRIIQVIGGYKEARHFDNVYGR